MQRMASEAGEVKFGFDDVENPRHYAGDGKIAAMDAMKSMSHGAAKVMGADAIYWWLCAFKYLWRWPWKNGRKDLRKCRQCIDYLMEATEGDVK